MEDKILLTQEGYDEYLNQLEKMKEKFYETGMLKKEANEQAPGDGWHDNFAYEDAVREENAVLYRLQALNANNKKIQIVKEENHKDRVCVHDKIKLEMIYSDTDKEIETFLLSGSYTTKSDQEITLNSPLGRAIYLQKIGSTISYKTSGKTIKVHILEKV